MSGRCPFGPIPTKDQVDPDQPCPICGDYGDARALDQPSRCVDSVPVVNLLDENERLRARIAELEAMLNAQ